LPEPNQDPERPQGSDAPTAEGGSSLRNLLPALFESLIAILSGKIRLFEIELSRDLSRLKVAGYLVVGLAVLLGLALLFAGAGAALLLGAALGSTATGFLAVGGVYLLAALILLAAGWKRIRQVESFLAETRAELRRDGEWLKHLF
jgi:uncharacterized membrane protein YqjE